MTATAATTGFSTTIQKASTAIIECVKISAIGAKKDTVEVTNLSSPSGCKEFITAMTDNGEFDAEVNYIPGNATHKAIITDAAAGTSATYTVTLPSAGTFIGTIAPIQWTLQEIGTNVAMKLMVKFKVMTGAWTTPTT